jgi:hypothetical protein
MAGTPRTSKQPAGLRGELSGSAWVRRRGRSAICPRDVRVPRPRMGRFGHGNCSSAAGCRAIGGSSGRGGCLRPWRSHPARRSQPARPGAQPARPGAAARGRDQADRADSLAPRRLSPTGKRNPRESPALRRLSFTRAEAPIVAERGAGAPTGGHPDPRRRSPGRKNHLAGAGSLARSAPDLDLGAWPIRLDGLQSAIRTVVRSCGDVWIRQGLATGEREPRMLLRPR